MKHTPGPWIADIYGAHPDDAIGGQINGPNDAHIADLPNYGQDSGVSQKQFDANARLIAAAPDLLAALLKVQPFIESHALEGEAGNNDGQFGCSVAEEMRDEIRAAIAKAKPRTPKPSLPRERKMNKQSGYTTTELAIILWCILWFALTVSILGGVIYIIIHFVAKFW